VLHELDAGRGQIVVLLGEAGVGKTRLLAELRTLAADRATWLEGHCLSYGTELLYDPFIRILRSWIGAEESEPETSVEPKLRGKLGLVPAFAEEDVLPYLARLLALSAGSEADDRLRALPHDELGAGIRRACRVWLSCLAERGPVVVALEDLHWLDPATALLADGLLDLTEQVPLLLVCTMRADPASHGWRLRGRIHQELAQRSTELHLEPLSEAGSRRLLASLPRSRELDESSLDLVVASAEGNPLYLEELLTAFADGTARKRGQTWAPTATSHRVLTPTLEGIMLSRLDRLPRGARRLAQTAAVIGRRFPLGVLEHLAPAGGLAEELATLLRADVIHEARRYPETEYTFRHGLLREAVLATMPPPRRRELYGAVAAAFEAHLAGSPEDHAELLAHYYVRGGEHAKALDCLRRAAARAAELDARAHAAELWERAAKVAARLGDEPEEARLRALSAEALAGGASAA
jgi:predicted ATPase